MKRTQIAGEFSRFEGNYVRQMFLKSGAKERKKTNLGFSQWCSYFLDLSCNVLPKFLNTRFCTCFVQSVRVQSTTFFVQCACACVILIQVIQKKANLSRF